MYPVNPQQTSSGRGCSLRLIMAAVVVAISLITYYSSQSVNPVTNEVQHVSISPEQEISMGLQAAPEMAAEFGGLDSSPVDQQRVSQIPRTLEF